MSTLLIISAIIIVLFPLGVAFLVWGLREGINNKYKCDEIFLKKRENQNDNNNIQQDGTNPAPDSAETASDL